MDNPFHCRPVLSLSQSGNTGSGIACILILLVGAAALIALTKHAKSSKRRFLLDKYGGDIEAVEKIMQKVLWEGESREQLLDSLGNPAAVDRKTMKSKTREIWKYNRRGANRFALRVIVEDGIVVGWEQKS